MARVGCFCGEAMSNVDERRTNMMSVYKKRDVWRTLERLGDIRLYDFEANWYEGAVKQENEYWYCRKCGRFMSCAADAAEKSIAASGQTRVRVSNADSLLRRLRTGKSCMSSQISAFTGSPRQMKT